MDQGEIEIRFSFLFAKAFQPVRDCFPDHVWEILDRMSWDAEVHVYYGLPGPLGERRRQAARLYPRFAYLIGSSPELRALVDAGRPYDRELLRLLRSTRAVFGDLTLAHLRRTRGMPRSTEAKHIEFMAALPVDWLPETPEAWQALWKVADVHYGFCVNLGLRPADVLRGWGGRWEDLARRHERPADWIDTGARDHNLRAKVSDARDVARRLHETLVMPVGLLFRGADPRLAGLKGLAGRLLYGGKTLAGILGISDEWHRGITRFESSLPRANERLSWPALIAPWDASNGIHAVALTSLAQLRQEGADGIDGDGVRGLRHCVGGYGARCYSGHCHILSFRRLGPDGAGERLSTLEVVHSAKGEWTVAQHRGLANAIPPEEALAAERELLAALNDPAAGIALVDGRARRDPAGFDAPFDARDPDSLRRAFEAWAPYLPKAVVAAGPEGLVERVRAHVEARHTSLSGQLTCPSP